MTRTRLLIQRGTTLLVVAWLALLVGSFVQRRVSEPRVVPEGVDDTPGEGGDRPVHVQRGADFNEMTGGQTNFRLAAKEVVEYASGWFRYLDVQVSFYHGGEVAYGLIADEARYNPALKEGKVGGHAQLSLRGGVTVRAEGFDLQLQEREVRSAGPTVFAGPSWGGLAGRLRCDLANNVVELSEGVSGSSRLERNGGSPPAVVLAEAVRYDQRQGTLTLPAGAQILRGDVRMAFARGEVQVRDGAGLQRARVSGPLTVAGTLDDGSLIDVVAGDAEGEQSPGGIIRFAAQPAARGWVRLAWHAQEVGRREMAAWRLVGEGVGRRLDWIEGQGMVCAEEHVPGGEPRRLTAERLRVELTDGKATAAVATGSVRLDEGANWATGGELRYSIVTRVATLLPPPGARVRLGSADVTAACDQATSDAAGGLRAEGQVAGELARGGLAADAGPTRFAAERVSVPNGGATLVLEGDARVWQGDRLLRASRLAYDRTGDVVDGSGDVMGTVVVARARERAQAGPMVVRARQLHYDRGGGRVVFEGDVVVEDGQATARCQQMTATFDAKGAVKAAELDGGVTVLDRTTGRELRGQHGRAITEADTFEMWGQPVVLLEPSGNQVKAENLLWRRSSNSVVVRGGPDKQTETIYHADEDKRGKTRRNPSNR